MAAFQYQKGFRIHLFLVEYAMYKSKWEVNGAVFSVSVMYLSLVSRWKNNIQPLNVWYDWYDLWEASGNFPAEPYTLSMGETPSRQRKRM